MTIPNRITFLRILFIPLLIYFLLANSLPYADIIAAALFVVLSLSDALDGMVARTYNQESELGKLIDPVADKLLVYGALLAMIETGKLWSWPVLLLIVRDFAVMGLRVWAAKKGTILAASPLGKSKTALQMAAIFFLILNLPFRYLLFAGAVALTVFSGYDYFKETAAKELL